MKKVLICMGLLMLVLCGCSHEKAVDENELNLLKEKYPEYFDLDESKGLDVIVWQMAEETYCFALVEHSDDFDGSSLLVRPYKSATAEDMGKILSSYGISKKEANIIPWRNPISSYLGEWAIWNDANANKRYINSVKKMLFN